jgi:acetate kinase
VEVKRDLHVLALNSGSSSLKFGLYRVRHLETERLIAGNAESIGEDAGIFHAEDAKGRSLLHESAPLPNQAAAMVRVARLLTDTHIPVPQTIGHRIVHGGPKLRRHCLIDESVLRELDAAVVFAPLHMPAALSVIRFCETHFSGLPQVACFDTSFHAQMPDIARVLPIPRALQSEGVQRYGFHGLSCESIVAQLAGNLPARLIIAHLGNGASVTAVLDGQSIDTSMGLTPTGGLIMGTRSGDLDPGVLVYLARQKKLDATTLEELVDRRSGLLGISGCSEDLRALHMAATSNTDARLAIDMFCYSAAKQIAAMSAVLGTVDLIVFTGGIGENDLQVRAQICSRLDLVGVRLDEVRNREAGDPISDGTSSCQVRVLPSQEDEQIARHAWTLY